MRPAELFSADQCMGTNSVPGCCPRLTRTRSTAVPWVVATCASVPCSSFRRAGIVGMNLDERLGDMRGKARRQALCASWCATGRARGRYSARTATRPRRRPTGAAAQSPRSAPCRSSVKKPPSANRRGVGAAPARSGHWNGSRRSNASLLEASAPEISKARSPSFSKPESRACSWKISSADRIGERVAVAEPPRHLAHHPPVRPRASRQRQERRAGARCTAPSW